MSTVGKEISCLAAVCTAPNTPLLLKTIKVAPPRANEMRIKVLWSSICHTDVYTAGGQDSEANFPCILGHEGVGVIESLGEGCGDEWSVGDYVIPLYVPECGKCSMCTSGRPTNLCSAIRQTQGKGQMPDGTVRFTDAVSGEAISHYMGCSTFSQYTVIADISCVKITNSMILDEKNQLHKLCLFGCGLTTGWGAVRVSAGVREGDSVAIFGLGTVGLSCVQAAKNVGCREIVAIDVDSRKFEIAQKLGATHCINPKIFLVDNHGDDDVGKHDSRYDGLLKYLLDTFDGGFDHTFECIGNTQIMELALKAAHKGWGMSTIIGVASAGERISCKPFLLVTGRKWTGSAFGGIKASQLGFLIEEWERGNILLDDYITASIGLDSINVYFAGDGKTGKNSLCIKTVINMWSQPKDQ